MEKHGRALEYYYQALNEKPVLCKPNNVQSITTVLNKRQKNINRKAAKSLYDKAADYLPGKRTISTYQL
jgi:hypothetical protein